MLKKDRRTNTNLKRKKMIKSSASLANVSPQTLQTRTTRFRAILSKTVISIFDANHPSQSCISSLHNFFPSNDPLKRLKYLTPDPPLIPFNKMTFEITSKITTKKDDGVSNDFLEWGSNPLGPTSLEKP